MKEAKIKKHRKRKGQKMGSWCALEAAPGAATFWIIILEAASQFLWNTDTLSTISHEVTSQQNLSLVRFPVTTHTFQNEKDLKRKSEWGRIFECNMKRWEAGVKSSVRPVLGRDWVETGNGPTRSCKCGFTKPYAGMFCVNVKQNSLVYLINAPTNAHTHIYVI